MARQDMRSDLLDAAARAGVQERLRVVGPHRYKDILIKTLNRFTTLGSRGLAVNWWWEDLKGPTAARQPDRGLQALREVLPADARIWLIVEDAPTDVPRKKNGRHWVIETDVYAALRTLAELHHAEYYLVDRAFEWMVCENHHGVVIVSGAEAVEWLSQIPG